MEDGLGMICVEGVDKGRKGPRLEERDGKWRKGVVSGGKGLKVEERGGKWRKGVKSGKSGL